MTETKITTKSGITYTFFGIENDSNGNPRFVVHYSDRSAMQSANGYQYLTGSTWHKSEAVSSIAARSSAVASESAHTTCMVMPTRWSARKAMHLH